MSRRVCLFTGAGGVLGNVFCQLMAEMYDIVAVYHSEPPLCPSQDAWLIDPLRPRQAIGESARRVFGIRADLASAGEIERVVELSLARFGRVDLLVNAAADVRTKRVLTDPGSAADWEEQLRINAVVPVQVGAVLTQAFFRTDEAGNRRANRNIVNVGSTAGFGLAAEPGRGIYAASKAALHTLTKQMAVEYRPYGVRVNAAAPTYFPEAVSTESVVEAIVDLDQGQQTGDVVVLELGRCYFR